jgi:hypothetical protein
MSTLTANMSLVLPTIGIDSGLTWEQSVNINSGIVDGHNHANGSGVQINPSGININADLPFNGFNATTLRSVRFNAQGSPVSLPADLDCIYVSGVDLYYNDGNGNQIRITSGGTVNATSSGISSGTNTASFSSSTLVVDSASNTPANIQVGSVLVGNSGVSGSKFITISPTGTLSANYNLNLPALPAQTNVLTLDTSGNISSITYDQVGQDMTSVGADAIAASRTRSIGAGSEGIGGVAISNSSGNFSTGSTSPVNVTNLSVQLVTSGRPVQILLISDGSSNPAEIFTSAAEGQINYSNASGIIGSYFIGPTNGVNNPILMLDTPAAGTQNYSIQIYSVSSGTTGCKFYKLVAYEL